MQGIEEPDHSAVWASIVRGIERHLGEVRAGEEPGMLYREIADDPGLKSVCLTWQRIEVGPIDAVGGSIGRGQDDEAFALR